jgi:hypothetical protein
MSTPDFKAGDPVRVFSIGFGVSFPGTITEKDRDGTGYHIKTRGRPDGDGPRWYPGRFVCPADSFGADEARP